MSVWTRSPLPSTTRFMSSRFLRLATAAAASPFSSVELTYGSGSLSVLDATYFCLLLSASVNGLSFRFGQIAKKSS